MSKQVRSDPERRVYWEGFWAGFGRTIAGFIIFIVIYGLYVGMDSATVGSITIGSLIFIGFSIIIAFDKAGDAVRAWRDRGSRD